MMIGLVMLVISLVDAPGLLVNGTRLVNLSWSCTHGRALFVVRSGSGPVVAQATAGGPGDSRDHVELPTVQVRLPRTILANLVQRPEPHRIADDVTVGISRAGPRDGPIDSHEVGNAIEHRPRIGTQ